MKWRKIVIKNFAESHEIQTAFVENGTLPKTVTFDPKGSSYNNSLPEQGTEFQVCLPFTVSVSRALIVRVGDDLYAVPLDSI
jgi:hypothetical protein